MKVSSADVKPSFKPYVILIETEEEHAKMKSILEAASSFPNSSVIFMPFLFNLQSAICNEVSKRKG